MNFKFKNPFEYKIIYVMTIDDQKHRGLIKIGETTVKADARPDRTTMEAAARNRIAQYTRTAAFDYDLRHVEIAVDDNHNTFSDRDVHRVLKNSGITRHFERREWFKINLPTALAAIDAVKRGRKNLTGLAAPDVEKIFFRPEQNAAINATVKIFKGAQSEKFLWNAKMRFGKTLCALEVIRQCRFRRSLIITHRPVVNDAWLDDFNKIFGGSDYRYGEISDDAPFVYFASVQDLRGSTTVGGNFDKNADIFAVDWQMLIVDEAHEGIATTLGDKVIKNLVKPRTNILMLSGTPFNLVDDFDKARTFDWTYADEQRAKEIFAADNPLEHNPYAELPRLNILTYDIGSMLDEHFIDIDDAAFDFAEFFRVDQKIFVHEDAVRRFLDLLTRAENFPFANDRFRQLFKHTLWIVPGVDEAKALKNLLEAHPVFRNFNVLNVAGNDDAGGKALKKVRNAIADNDWTITVSCRRLTVGVTVPEWSAVLMLSGSSTTSATSYMQTIFRVQSPCTVDGKIKTDCYVFDFAPDRALKVLADVADRHPALDRRSALEEFLNFAPVIAFDGSRMLEYDVNKFFEQIKRVNADKVFNAGFDSPLLFKNFSLDDVDRRAFNRLKKIIDAVKGGKDKPVVVNAQGLDRKKYSRRDTNDADSTRKDREKFIALLRGLAVRLPLMIYGADVDERDISIERIASVVDDRSWAEFMPRGLDKNLFREFVRYFDEDIFAAAARKILDVIRAADDLAPDNRVKKIAELFSTFKNPDKETVLTPWRVVCEHLRLTVEGKKFLSVRSVFLDINSKTGLYPLCLTQLIWNWKMGVARAMECGREPTFEEQIKIWRATVEKNIFVLCRTPMAAKITRRTLLGFRAGWTANIRCVEDIVERLRDCFDRDDFEAFAVEIRSKSFWRKGARGTMKFDAVVGNPPYQTNAEGGPDLPVYHYFIEAAQHLADRATLIHPARFLFDAGATPKRWNKKILLDKHWKVVKYEADSRKFFPDGDIKGGVAITYYDANEDFGSTDAFIAFDELKSIHQKVVVDNKNFHPLNEIIYSATIYRLTKKFHEDNPWAVKRLSKGHSNDVVNNIFERLPEIFTIKKPDDDRDYIQLLGLERMKRVYRYVRRDYISYHQTLEKYKVFVPVSNGSGSIGETLSSPLVGSPLVGSPLVACTQTFITVGSFESISEAEAVFKYIKTKFCRAMLGILKVTQHNSPATWSKVPLQDFTSASDIDWSLSVSELDRALYRKYNLSPDEIAFIETRVRAME